MAGLKVFDGSAWRATGVEDSQWDILNATALGSSVDLSWPTAGGSPSYYEIFVDGSIINAGNVTSYNVSGLTIGQNYNFKVRPVYSDGSTGGWSYFKNRGPNGFNLATGGSVTTVNNFNGTGQSWKVHVFTSNSNFVVTDSPGVNDFRVLVVGGGGGGGSGTNGGGGGAGQVIDTTLAMTTGTFPVVVGNGGGAGRGYNTFGGTSSISSLSATGGETGGNNYGSRGGNSGNGFSGAGSPDGFNRCGGGAGASANGSNVNGGAGVTTTIEGSTSVGFAGGGGGGSRGTGHGSGADGGGRSNVSASRRGSGGGGAEFDSGGGSGFRGEVIVAYRIA